MFLRTAESDGVINAQWQRKYLVATYAEFSNIEEVSMHLHGQKKLSYD